MIRSPLFRRSPGRPKQVGGWTGDLRMRRLRRNTSTTWILASGLACLLGGAAQAAVAPPPAKPACVWEPVYGNWTIQRTPRFPPGDMLNGENAATGSFVRVNAHETGRRVGQDGWDWEVTFAGSVTSNTGRTGTIVGSIAFENTSLTGRFETRKFAYLHAVIAWSSGYQDGLYMLGGTDHRGVHGGHGADLGNLQDGRNNILHLDGRYGFQRQSGPADVSDDWASIFTADVPFRCAAPITDAGRLKGPRPGYPF
jgi:hypothetical protein